MSFRSAVADLVSTARAHGERVAVESHETPPLTYAALLARASALAASLRAEGLGRGDLVALDLDKSSAYVVALAGVWLAGAAFLPLDPCLPPERRRFILEEARPRRVLGAADVAPISAASPFEPASLDPEDVAYVIYTSGTTGAPKGVLVPHRGLPNLLHAQIAAFDLAPGCRSLFHLSTSFDASISDIGTALLSGATLVIERPEHLASAAGLLDVLQRRAITHADLPPALLPAIDPALLPASLSTVIIGGEPCPPDAVRRWAHRVRVLNVYGPTEATVCASLGACDARTWTRPLLGAPLPGVVFRVVDEHLATVPDGTPGELCIGGVGLAHGYLGRPELTRLRFVALEGARFYRTGDRVVRRADGEHEFLGRLDRQVKLRGRRIELEEIEARLRDHADVETAAVVARPLRPEVSGGAPACLVAFVVPRDPGAPVVEARLRSDLGESLPAWMIPARFCFLPELPRAPSGKVDLQALEALPIVPALARGASRWSGAAAVLEALWCDVLGVDAVAATDDFGALGGDSAALVEVVARAEAAGLPLAAERLWGAHPTFGELCVALSRGELGAGDRRDVAELRRDVEGELTGLGAPPSAADAADGAILLTGAAGALGSRLLLELVATTASPLVCVVRAPDDVGAAARVARAVARHGGVLPGRRVQILAGDLARPRFGLDDGAWHRLAAGVASIYHAAGCVGGLRPYEALRADNVESTREVVRLAVTTRRKRVHHVSTLSVLSQAERDPGPLDEHADLEASRAVLGGYAQSKWAAERLVRVSGVPGSVFRLGLLAPSDHLTRFFRGLRDLGCAPSARIQLALDVTPVEHAARAIVALSGAPGRTDLARHATFHVANPEPAGLADVIAAARAAGVAIEELPAETFGARAGARIGASAEAALAYLSLCRALGDTSLARHRGLDLFEATGLCLGMDATLAALACAGVGRPPPARALLVEHARAART